MGNDHDENKAETAEEEPENTPNHLKKRKRGERGGKYQTFLGLLMLLAVGVSSMQMFFFHHTSESAVVAQDVRQLEDFLSQKRDEVVEKPPPGQSAERSTSRNQTVHDASKVDVASNSTQEDGNPFVQMLQKAGENVTDDLFQQLSIIHRDWKQLYGTEPIILGMETCEAYRQMVPRQRRIIAVAGLFNTGTNAMEFHLRKNIRDTQTKWQVPWGKHRVPRVRLQHKAPGLGNVPQEDVLPIVILRDPLHWMQSMCKSPYAANWKRTRLHCPNLVPTPHDHSKYATALRETNNTFPVTVHFDKAQVFTWASLIHLYSDWYRQYLDAPYPRLLVRFEDMLWQAPTILERIATCVGTQRANPVAYQVKASKGHGSGTGLVKAILKSGNATLRYGQLTNEDLQYANQHVDHELLERVQYSIPTGLVGGS